MSAIVNLIEDLKERYHLIERQAVDTVLVTLSGGLDSTVLLYLLRYLGFQTIGMEFTYSTRPQQEVEALQAICRMTNTELISIPYPTLKAYAGPSNLKRELVENNGLYYMIACNLAFVNNIRSVFCGLIESDWVTEKGQNSPYLFRRINEVLSIEYGKCAPALVTPFIELSKSEVMRIGHFLNVPMELTWSCVENSSLPCLQCENCQVREDAIMDIFDPGSIVVESFSPNR